MPGTKLRGREILQLFYTEVDRAVSVKGVQDKLDGASIFQCKCGKTRAQNLKHGYTNLVQHVVVKHSDWVEAALREAVPCPVPASITRDERRARKEKGKSESEKKNESKREDMTESKTTIPNARDEEPTPPSTIVVTSTTSEPVQVLKRSDYLSWDDYFMSVAFLSAMRSKDPSTQVGACIVNPDRKIVGIGYNGFPNGCGDDDLPWARESETNSLLETKYPYVCHAEMNAILNKNCADVKGCTIYVALFPCNECTKLIIQSGIARVVYCSDKYKLDWRFVASRRLLDMAGVQYTHHRLERSKIVIDFSTVE